MVAQAPTEPLPPREKPTEYQASVALPASRTLAADYLAHSAPTIRGMLFAPNHVVIEVALFGPGNLQLQPSHFRLQMTGGRGTPKDAVAPEPSSVVAASMREGSSYAYGRPNLEAAGSVNNRGIVLGRRYPTTGAPDIDSQRPGRGSDPPRTGAPGHDRSGNTPEGPINAAEELAKVELEGGDRKLPARGLLFFPYAGKLKSLRTITLLYQPDPGGKAISLSLLP